jgi:hypothetical protein
MRIVVDSRQVAHLWAHQAQGHARNDGNTVHFQGPDFYSYSTVIAHLDLEKKVAFISNHSHSPTTSIHQGHAHRAIRGNDYKVYSSDWSRRGCYFPGVEQVIKMEAEDLQELFKSLDRWRERLVYEIGYYNARREELQEIATLYGFNLPDLPDIPEKLIEKARAYEQKAEERRQQREKEQIERAAKARIEYKKDFDKWLNGEPGSYCPRAFYKTGDPPTMSLTVRDETVYTSAGAQAPLDHVAKAVKFWLSRRNQDGTFKPYQTNGHTIHLGSFKMESISETGTVKAGCHVFTRGEIERFINRWELNQ